MERVWTVSVSYGELVLKGKNKGQFISRIEQQMAKALQHIAVRERYEQFGKFFVEVREDDVASAVKALQKVFGLVYVTPGIKVNRDISSALDAALFLLDQKPYRTFKVEVKRADKSFPGKSPEIAAELGGDILEKRPDLQVDVKNPEAVVTVEIRKEIFVSLDRIKGLGGLPAGMSGKGLLLLSGGIDSPVAGFELARRGMGIDCVHFHSHPFTGEKARDKAIRLAEKLSEYTGLMQLHMINLVDTYIAVQKYCQSGNMTILARRMMMRIGKRICDRESIDAMITGESLGQVASQTIQGIQVVDEASGKVILRPLIARDKAEIVERARRIGTYDLSIEPYDDCCSVFAPDRPNIKPTVEQMLLEEEKLDIADLLQKAEESIETIFLK